MMRIAFALVVLLSLPACDSLRSPVQPVVDRQLVFQYANYCAVPPDGARSALSYVETGFGYVEQQCGIFFDKLAELTQSGRFSVKALNATNLGTQSILQAAKVAAQNVVIVGSALTLTEAIFNAFIEQYAFAPYLYKIRELTWQAFSKHKTDNSAMFAQLKFGFTPDDYCSAYVLVQQHANICTISYLQMMFDQQVANATVVVTPPEKEKERAQRAMRPALTEAAPRSLTRGVSPQRTYAPLLPVSPNYTVR